MVGALPPVTLLITGDLSSRRLATLGRAAFVEHRSRVARTSCLPPSLFDRKTRSNRTSSPRIDASRLSEANILEMQNYHPWNVYRSGFFFLLIPPAPSTATPSLFEGNSNDHWGTSSGSRQTGLSVLSLTPWSLGVGCNKGGTRGRSNLEKGRILWARREKDKSFDALNRGGGNWISVIMCIHFLLQCYKRDKERGYI